MAVKAVAKVVDINSGTTDPTMIDVTLHFVGIAPGQSVTQQTLVIQDMDPTITNLTWEAALKQAVRDRLINGGFGYTFGLLDSVRLVGNTLL